MIFFKYWTCLVVPNQNLYPIFFPFLVDCVPYKYIIHWIRHVHSQPWNVCKKHILPHFYILLAIRAQSTNYSISQTICAISAFNMRCTTPLPAGAIFSITASTYSIFSSRATNSPFQWYTWHSSGGKSVTKMVLLNTQYWIFWQFVMLTIIFYYLGMCNYLMIALPLIWIYSEFRLFCKQLLM